MQTKLYNRAMVSRVIGKKPPNLDTGMYREFFESGMIGPSGRLWTEEQVIALCEHLGVEFDAANAGTFPLAKRPDPNKVLDEKRKAERCSRKSK